MIHIQSPLKEPTFLGGMTDSKIRGRKYKKWVWNSLCQNAKSNRALTKVNTGAWMKGLLTAKDRTIWVSEKIMDEMDETQWIYKNSEGYNDASLRESPPCTPHTERNKKTLNSIRSMSK